MSKKYRIVIAGLLVIAAVVWLTAQALASRAIAAYQTELESQVADQRAVLVDFATVTARNGADQVTESLVQDCGGAEREQFDVLLGQLDSGLSDNQLATLQDLFNQCGDYYAVRKAVMVERFAREVDFYAHLDAQLAQLTGEDREEELTQWQALIDLEQQQARHFTNLVAQQDDIIDALVAGETVSSPAIVEILEAVREAQENLVLANTQAASIRNQLLSL